MIKYVGRTVEIIYMDRSGKFSQRRIRVCSVQDTIVRAYCYSSRSVRTFRLDNILAEQPVVKHAAV